ncbi:MAG: aminotransferase class IV, partial [Haloferacaceae archaeon]
TPGLSQSILDGITRQTVIDLAEERGYTVHDQATISRGELHTADELFFTGTAAEVTPIRQVGNVEIGDRGPVTEELQSAFFDLVERRTDAHDDWFTYVEEA